MKKLKLKVFMIIFSILSLFILGVLILNNINNYNQQLMYINDILKGPIMDRGPQDDKDRNKPLKADDTTRKIFMNSTVYTVILDENSNFVEIINHTEYDKIDEDSIYKIATNIINNHNKNRFIGNLYFDKYAYLFTNNNMLIIVDNTSVNNELRTYLLISLIVFILIEIVVYFISYLLTRWIIVPVNNSFEKQKQFIADASHELKTPLAIIMANTDAYLNDKDAKWLNNIKSESERMNKLITELLNLAKLENNKDIVMQKENISNIVESAILTFESLLYEKKIKLSYDVEENINLFCNQDQIKELIGILIDNAIKYSDKNGKVIINLSSENKMIILEVRNKGIPISEEDAKKIFDRFYKVDASRNRNNNNYGLGLAIAKNIVEAHNGKISAYSKDGITTFKVIWSQK